MLNMDLNTLETMPAPLPCRVVKLGGSLLDLPHLAARLQSWLAGEPDKLSLLLVGGGEFVEAMRQLDGVHAFDAAWCHWKCLELMAFTSSLVEPLLPGWPVIRTQAELASALKAASSVRRALVQTAAFYNRECSEQEVAVGFPESWGTTSDSLAALLAVRVRAEELVLLKSAVPIESANEHRAGDEAETLRQWSLQGYVDDHFYQVALLIPCVRVVNLRGS